MKIAINEIMVNFMGFSRDFNPRYRSEECWVSSYDRFPMILNEFSEKAELPANKAKLIEAKAEDGFNLLIPFPSIKVQQAYLPLVIREAEEPMQGLADDQQFQKIWFSPHPTELSSPDKIKSLNRPENKPYFLLIRDDREAPEETLHRSADELRNIFKKKEETGFTLFEYLIFQRDYTLRHAKSKKPHPDIEYGSWLLDSQLPDGQVLCVMGYLKDYFLRIWSWPSDFDETRFFGARSGIVISLD